MLVSYRKRPGFAPHHFEGILQGEGVFLCGIDEAGRGPLAGPIVAAAAMVYGGNNPLLRDSKCLSPRQRAEGYAWLLSNSWFGVGIASNRIIDQLGIVIATNWAMRRAFRQLLAVAPCPPACVLVDAVPLRLEQGAGEQSVCECKGSIDFREPALSVTTMPALCTTVLSSPWGHVIAFPESEEFSYSIAAASIIAKVTRDRLMTGIAESFPGYELAVHKGYGTVKHRAYIAAQGTSLVHRTSFAVSSKSS